jgi:hypothetical protein
MAVLSSTLGALRWETESTWGENSGFSSPKRIPIISPIDFSGLNQDRMQASRVVQYRNAGTESIPGPTEGSFTFRTYITGHGSTTSGATAATDQGTLLGWIFGAVQVAAANGTTLTGGTAAAPTTTASGTFDAGSLCRIGAANDNRGNGQWAAIGTHVTTTLNLNTAIDGAPSNGDVLFSAEVISTLETSGSLTSAKFQAQTGDMQILMHGCYPQAVKISGTGNGELLQLEVTIGVSWWEPVADTFPTTTSVDTFTPSPNSNGSFFFNAHGTATRAELAIRSMTIDYTLGVQPLRSPDGVKQYQTITSAKRVPDALSIEIVVDAEGADATPTYYDAWLTGGKFHALYSATTATGQAVGFYFPCLRYIGARPIQVANDNVNAIRLRFVAYANDTVTTDDLTLSMFRIGLA